MLDFALQVTIDPTAFNGFVAGIPAALKCNAPLMRGAMNLASAELMRFEHARFRSASGGDGTWVDLAMLTKLNRLRRQAKASGSKRRITRRLALGQHLPILYETGALEAGLFENGAPGHFIETNATSIREGARGGTHPSGKISIGALAVIQHYGAGRIPARPVMGPPDGNCLATIGGILATGVQGAFNQLVSGYGFTGQQGAV